MTHIQWIVIGGLVVTGGLTPVTRAICALPQRDISASRAVRLSAIPPRPRARRSTAGQQTVRPFEEIARDLTSPHPNVRVEAMRTLASAAHPNAIAHIAVLLTDPIDEIQSEAIDTLIGFYMIDVPKKSRKIAYMIEVDSGSRGERAFERGPFIAAAAIAGVAEEGTRRRDARRQSEDPPRSDLRARRARAAACGTRGRSRDRRQHARSRRSDPLRCHARRRRRPRHHHHRRHRRRDQRSG